MGGLFGGGQTIDTSAPVIAGFRVQTSAYARPIPRIFGKSRVSANLMWYDDFTAIPHTTTQSSGGKGGGGVEQTNTTYTYTAAALLLLGCGPVSAVTKVWRDKEQTTLAALGLSFYSGSASQTPFPHLSSNHPGQALAYRGLAYVASAALDLGDNASLGNHSFEVEGELPFSGSIKDAAVSSVVNALLLDAGISQTYIGDLAPFGNYCTANSIFISPAYTEQAAAAELLARLARIGNAEIVCSEEKIKLVPYSDQAATGNGVTYTPSATPLFEFGADDFLAEGEDLPVQFEDDDTADAFNIVTVQFYNRAKDYAEDVAQARDDDAIALYGERPMDAIVLHEIVDAAVARLVAQVELQRQLYYRMRYRFALGPGKADLLEPMDVIAITDSTLNLAALPVRILEIEELEEGERDGFKLYVREFPAGASSGVVYPSESGTGYAVNYNASPGNVATPLIFEAPVEKTNTTGLGVLIAVTGVSALWGGCQVWASLDGQTYKRVGTTYGGARYGTLSASLAAAPAGSDVTNTLSVALAGGGGQILSGTAADAQLMNTLCYVDGEYLSYVTATLTGANAYNLTNLMRGGYTTASGAHASGTPFARVDDAVQMMELDPAYIGKQVWFKFVSFNIFGGGLGDLAEATAYSYTVTGAMIKLPPPRVDTFLVGVQADGTRQFTWGYNAGAPADVTNGGGYRIKYFLGSTSDWAAMTDMHPTGLLTHSPFENNQLAAGTYTFAIKAEDVLGNESTQATFISATLTDPRLKNVLVQRMERGLGWPGTITGGFKYNGGILAASSTTIADLPATISALSSAIDTIGTNTSPIAYVTPVIDLGVNTSFTPLVTPTVQGTPTLTMKTGTSADGGVVGSWVPLANVNRKRYVQIQISVADAAPRIDELITLLDGSAQQDDFNDVNTATETATWFYRVAAGHFKIGSKSGKIAALSQASISALQNTNGAWTWELVNKTSTVNGQPAAEFKIRNASGVLADAVVDVILRGPRS